MKDMRNEIIQNVAQTNKEMGTMGRKLRRGVQREKASPESDQNLSEAPGGEQREQSGGNFPRELM